MLEHPWIQDVQIPKSGIKVQELESLDHAAYLLRGGQDISHIVMKKVVEEILTMDCLDSTAIFKKYYKDYKNQKEELA